VDKYLSSSSQHTCVAASEVYKADDQRGRKGSSTCIDNLRSTGNSPRQAPVTKAAPLRICDSDMDSARALEKGRGCSMSVATSRRARTRADDACITKCGESHRIIKSSHHRTGSLTVTPHRTIHTSPRRRACNRSTPPPFRACVRTLRPTIIIFILQDPPNLINIHRKHPQILGGFPQIENC